jgi:hypothetical protein
MLPRFTTRAITLCSNQSNTAYGAGRSLPPKPPADRQEEQCDQGKGDHAVECGKEEPPTRGRCWQEGIGTALGGFGSKEFKGFDDLGKSKSGDLAVEGGRQSGQVSGETRVDQPEHQLHYPKASRARRYLTDIGLLAKLDPNVRGLAR